MPTENVSPSAKVGVLLFSGTHGHGYGAERILDHLIENGSALIAGVIAPPSSTVSVSARNQGLPFLPWESDSNSTRHNLLAAIRFMRRHARRLEYTSLHAWHTRGFEWGLLLARHFRIPAFGTLHDDPTWNGNSKIRNWITPRAAQHLDKMACVSSALARICQDHSWRVPITTITNGLPDTGPPRAVTSGPEIHVGFLGLNERWKGIETVEILVERLAHRQIIWNLYGDPSAETAAILQGMIRRNPARVVHHGRKPPGEIYRKVDVIFHPSRRFDPYPTVLLESARAGIPAIASAVGGAPEIIRDGESGFLFPPEDSDLARDALERLASDSDLRARMGERARSRYERQFQVAKMVEAYARFWGIAELPPAFGN